MFPFVQLVPYRHSRTVCYVYVSVYIVSINFLSVQVRDEYRTDYDEGRGGYGKSAIRMFEKLGHPEYSGARNSM